MSNTNIKVAYKDLIAFLEENKNKKVGTILDEAKLMCEAKNGGSNGKTFEKDDEGNVTKVYCWYHKEWEDVSECEYGAKKGTATGLNTMCKQGVSSWTKQQRIMKKAEGELLTKIASGELLPEDLMAEQIAIKAEAKLIIPRA